MTRVAHEGGRDGWAGMAEEVTCDGYSILCSERVAMAGGGGGEGRCLLPSYFIGMARRRHNIRWAEGTAGRRGEVSENEVTGTQESGGVTQGTYYMT